MPATVLDPSLAVRVVGTRTLRYSASADPDDDRPPHVRAASGLAWVAIDPDDVDQPAVLHELELLGPW